MNVVSASSLLSFVLSELCDALVNVEDLRSVISDADSISQLNSVISDIDSAIDKLVDIKSSL